MRFRVFGAGRMGSIHTGGIAARESAELACAAKLNQRLARQPAD